MVRTETIIAVKDVPKSSKFYQDLLNCKSEHGGEFFEILTSENVVILCLHQWGEHEHPTMLNPEKEVGNGLILFFRVADLNTVFTNARKINATIEKKIHYNGDSGDADPVPGILTPSNLVLAFDSEGLTILPLFS